MTRVLHTIKCGIHFKYNVTSSKCDDNVQVCACFTLATTAFKSLSLFLSLSLQKKNAYKQTQGPRGCYPSIFASAGLTDLAKGAKFIVRCMEQAPSSSCSMANSFGCRSSFDPVTCRHSRNQNSDYLPELPGKYSWALPTGPTEEGCSSAFIERRTDETKRIISMIFQGTYRRFSTQCGVDQKVLQKLVDFRRPLHVYLRTWVTCSS